MKKVVIVTGASRGIGRDIAIGLAKQGYQVIANYYRSEEQAKQLENMYPNITAMKANVANIEEVKELVNNVYQTYGRIDVLINNAGISQIKLFTEITQAEWQHMMDVNLNGVFYMSQAVANMMIQQKKRFDYQYIFYMGSRRCFL